MTRRRGENRVRPVRWRRSVLLLALLTPLLIAGIAMGSIGSPELDRATGQPTLRAALVNEENTVFTVDLGGNEVPAPMGRLLVGELVTDSSNGFSWTLTDRADATAGLADGTYSAVVIIPENFSQAYLSSFGPAPKQAVLTVETDGSHSYLAAVLGRALAQNVQSSMSSTLTRGFVDTLLVGYTIMSEGLTDIGDAQSQLTVGLTTLTSVASLLPDSTALLADGAEDVDTGVQDLAGALWSLGQWSQGAVDTSAQLGNQLDSLETWVNANITNDAQKAALLTQISAMQAQSADLTTQTFESDLGIDVGAGAAWFIGQGSAVVAEGARELADATPALPDAIALASGGSQAIADVLTAAGKTVPQYSESQMSAISQAAANPITSDLITDPPLPQAIGAIGAVTIPVALWLGALVLAFIYAPYERRALRSRASTARIVWGSMLPAVIMAVVQTALVLAGLVFLKLSPMHNLGLIGLLFLSSIAFVVLHQGLAALLGRFAWLVSVALLSLQIVASGVVLPRGYLPDWVNTAGNVLPLAQSIRGAQELISAGSLSQALGCAVWLLVSAVIGVALSAIGVARGRNLRARLVTL